MMPEWSFSFPDSICLMICFFIISAVVSSKKCSQIFSFGQNRMKCLDFLGAKIPVLRASF